MAGTLSSAGNRGGRVLLAIAAETEFVAVAGAIGAGDSEPAAWKLIEAGRGFDAVLTGIGKANAAGAVATVLDASRHRLCVSLGIAGSLPRSGHGGPLPIGAVVAGSTSVMADEGLEEGPAGSHGFTPISAMGFPLGIEDDAVRADASALDAVGSVVDEIGPIATVSVCSATDGRAMALARRTGAIAEAMEGAAAGLVAHRNGVGFLELRVISNFTGDRDRQGWSIAQALERLGELAAAL